MFYFVNAIMSPVRAQEGVNYGAPRSLSVTIFACCVNTFSRLSDKYGINCNVVAEED